MAKFEGLFWCKKCGGRVMEDEPYKDGHGVWMAVVTCLLCGYEGQCTMKEYKSLLEKIENIAQQKIKASKSSKKQVLSLQR